MCFGYMKAKEDLMQFCSSTLLSGIRIESKGRLLCSHCSTYVHTTCRKSLFEQNKTGMGSEEGGKIWKRERMRNINMIEDKGNSGKKPKEEWE